MASIFRAVSRIDSPFERALLPAEILTVSAESRLAANSNEVRVRVEFSKNSMTTVLPLSAGAHITHDYSGLAGRVLGLDTINHAYDITEMNIDAEKSATIIDATRPGIVTFGGSLFPFPHPIKELAKVAKKLENEGFLNKAPADVIEKVRDKQGALLEKQRKLQMNLDRIKAAEK